VGTSDVVLIVDDDDAIRLSVSWALADAGYVVETAANGQAALDRIANVCARLVLLDMRMPVMDGWEFARRYRSMCDAGAPIVVMTAAQDAGDRARQIEADGHLAKPFSLDELLAIVRHHLPR
jgi:two-component system, chemotaxis family, chemotaxis protein CheY